MDSSVPSTTITQSQEANEWSAVYFTVAILGLVGVFTVFHWTAFLLKEYSYRDSRVVRSVLSITRSVQSVLLRRVPAFASLSHLVIFFIYLAINVALSFYNLDWSSLFGFAKRLGWVATCNIALTTFLALRNSPLAFLTGYSHEHLKFLHQVAGYSTVIISLLHAIFFTTALSRAGNLDDLLEDDNIMGVVAGLSMLSILCSILIFRKRYEVFYITHISLFTLILITVGMHRPDITLKSLIIIIFAAIIWVSDRSIRFARIIWYAFGNSASIAAHPMGGTRITLRSLPRGAEPGCHVFIWIPKIRAIETHPFTIVSADPPELVVSAHDGFTKDLFSCASKNPGAVLRISVDGPYGILPNFAQFDQVVLIAGGSGASFTFGVATNLVKKLGNSVTRPVVNFIWVVREYESLSWYAKELEILHASPLVILVIYVTRSIATTDTAVSLPIMPNSSAAGHENIRSSLFDTQDPMGSEKLVCGFDIEKSGNISTINSKASLEWLEIHSGRPDVATLIRGILCYVESHERIIVAACGPQSLMLAARSTVASILRAGNQNIELHCEHFRW